MSRRLIVIVDRIALRRTVRRLPAPITAFGLVARGGALWLAAAAVLALLGPRGRRAATGGLVATGTASVIANGPAKWLIRRPRPGGISLVGLPRRDRSPTTSSFPSSHTASAAAFAVAASAHYPAAGPVLFPAALAVGLSRIRAARHYPSDVLAGAALGAAIGAGTAYSVHRWCAARRSDPPTS